MDLHKMWGKDPHPGRAEELAERHCPSTYKQDDFCRLCQDTNPWQLTDIGRIPTALASLLYRQEGMPCIMILLHMPLWD